MASINLDIITQADSDRGERAVYTDLHFDLSLNYTRSNELEKQQQIRDIITDQDVGAIRNAFISLLTTSPGEKILNPLFVVILSPFISYLWIFLGKRMLDPSLPFKFGLGLIFMAIGFLVISIGAQIALSEGFAGAKWLLITYLLHTVGELVLSPIGLAAISSLSPKKYMGQMMGVWFLASSLGAIIAGLISGKATNEGLASMPGLFNQIALSASLFGLILIIIARPLQKWVFREGEEPTG